MVSEVSGLDTVGLNKSTSKPGDKLVRALMWNWRKGPVFLAGSIAFLCRFLPHPFYCQVWYKMAYDACRGIHISSYRAKKLLNFLGNYPQGVVVDYKHPPLWWALASRQSKTPDYWIYQWAARSSVPLSGRHQGYDFLIASIYAKNKQAFAWGIDQGLPVDGDETPEPDKVINSHTSYTCVSEIESDLRTPLWHAVNCTSLADPWWVETLVDAGAQWQYPGKGGVSAAELDQERNLGWNQWWTRKKLLAQAQPRLQEKMEKESFQPPAM